MAKFRVEFAGFVFVEAYNEEAALQKFIDEDYAYMEYEAGAVTEVDEFVVEVQS